MDGVGRHEQQRKAQRERGKRTAVHAAIAARRGVQHDGHGPDRRVLNEEVRAEQQRGSDGHRVDGAAVRALTRSTPAGGGDDRAGGGPQRERRRIDRRLCEEPGAVRQRAAHVQHVHHGSASEEMLERPDVPDVGNPDAWSQNRRRRNGRCSRHGGGADQQSPAASNDEVSDDCRQQLRLERQHRQPRPAGPRPRRLRRAKDLQHRHREQQRRLSNPQRFEYGIEREQRERDGPPRVAPRRAVRLSQSAIELRQQRQGTERPHEERRVLACAVRQPAERRPGERGVRRVEERHQAALEVGARQQRPLNDFLRGGVVQRSRAAMKDQPPPGPEHGEVAGGDAAADDEGAREREDEPGREADVDGADQAKGSTCHRCASTTHSGPR